MDAPSRKFRHIPSTVYLIKAAEASNRQVIDRAVKESPVTTMQYVALGVLEQRAGLTAAQLARRSFVTPQSMQDTVTTLQSKGLISRSPRENNKRDLLISLTEAGGEALRQLEPAMAEFDDEVLAGFSDDEVLAFRDMLMRAQKNAARFAA